jgi:hypothetical protein
MMSSAAPLLIGRGHELALLRGQFDAAREGSLRTVMLSGEPGRREFYSIVG